MLVVIMSAKVVIFSAILQIWHAKNPINIGGPSFGSVGRRFLLAQDECGARQPHDYEETDVKQGPAFDPSA